MDVTNSRLQVCFLVSIHILQLIGMDSYSIEIKLWIDLGLLVFEGDELSPSFDNFMLKFMVA